MATTTTYGLNKPTVGGDENTWGGLTNDNWDDVDDLLDGTTVVTGIKMDDTMSIVDNADNTKVAQFQVSGVTTATTRTFTFPDASGTLALTSDVIDEDDMATDSATRPPSQQSVKKYVDDRVVLFEDGEDATTSGTAYDFSIPSGVNEIEIHYWGVSLSGNDDILIQVGNGGTVSSSGYTSLSTNFQFANRSAVEGFVVFVGNAASAITGKMVLSRVPGTNKWFSIHNGNINNNTYSAGQGSVSLAGELDIVRLTRIASDGTFPGTNSFDAGGVSIRCRK